jgi:7,8-dihydro-6-hydroxymethylpterin dimethyltransferase
MSKSIIKTESVCPICLENIPALKYKKGTDVFIKKICPKHGEFVKQIAKDSKRFFDKTFSVEGKEFNPSCNYKKECGEDCGWCNEHEQHICTGLIEVTNACNLSCPICYFGKKGKKHISSEEFSRRLKTILLVEQGKLDVLQISGGECLIHPEFSDLLDIALQKNIGRILINSNGLALLKNESIFQKIKKHKDRVEVYLQFDGFDDDIYKTLRGKSLLKEKQEILQKLNNNGIKICLAVTIYQDNLKQIPDILDLCVKTKNISGVTFQRLTKVGNAVGTKIKSVFQEDILLALASSKLMAYKDIIPLPCSHENCTSLAFLFCTKDKVYSIGDFIDYSKCKDVISNRIAFDNTILEYMEKNICNCFVGKIVGSSFALEKLQEFSKGEGSQHNDMKIVRIIVKNFMDVENFDFERAKKCCTGVSIGDNKVIPFCIYNMLKGKRSW